MSDAFTPPNVTPPSSFIVVEVPHDLAKVLGAAAKKNYVLHADQLLAWAQQGAECARLHSPKIPTYRRKTK